MALSSWFKQTALFCVFATIAVSALAMDAALPVKTDEIDRMVTRAMKAFSVPGVAIGVVENGELVFAKGYGVRTAGGEAPVDADTLFAIGSNTKAFTAAALAILVDQGRIAWDDKVADYLPEFRLYDPYVTAEFTIRDLLTHRSGLRSGAGDLMIFPSSDFTREEIIERLRYLRPVSSFRSEFAYNNLLYMVAGEVITAITGQSWADFVQSRLLEPLGMTECAAAADRVGGTDNIAAPHVLVSGKLQRVEPMDVTVVAAAGSIQCNITGMARWLATLLTGGVTPDGDRMLSEEQQEELWTPQTLQSVPAALAKFNNTHFKAYGLGWGLADFHGYKQVAHAGGVLGMVSFVNLLPEKHLGIIVLTNQQSGGAMQAITMYLLKAYAGASQRDWVELFKTQVEEEAAARRKLEAQIERTVSAAAGAAPLPLPAYTGNYWDDWRGLATIRRTDDGLVLKFSRTNELQGSLQHYRNGIFIVRWDDRRIDADAYVRFSIDFDGNVVGMTMKRLPTADSSFDFEDLDFRRMARDNERE